MSQPSSDPRLRRPPHARKQPATIHWPIVVAAVVLCGAALTGLILAVSRDRTSPPVPVAKVTRPVAQVVPEQPDVKGPPALAPLVPEEKLAPARAEKPPAAATPPAVPVAQPEKPKPAVRQPDPPRLPVTPAEKKTPPPPPEKKAPPRKPAVLTADKFQELLLKVPEVDFFNVAERLKQKISEDVADPVRASRYQDYLDRVRQAKNGGGKLDKDPFGK